MWRRSIPAIYLGEQQDQEREDTQKEVVYICNEGSDSDGATEQGEHLASIQHINVVRCTLTQPNKTDDGRRTTIFHTWMKIGNKSCKIIVDSGSCINVVSFKLISMISLKVVPHPCPYKVSWVNTTSIEVNKRCLVPVQFATYKDKIWCDVLAMDTMSHVILGRPWLFNLDVTLREKI